MKTNIIRRRSQWLIVLLSFLLPTFGFNQTEADLISKYWKYRQRLVGSQAQFNLEPGFLRVGSATGHSLVAISRNRLGSNFNLWPLDPDTPFAPCKLEDVHQTLPVQKGWINYSDATIIHGFYLAVLASEWKLLNDTGADVTDTEDEIYHALLALERLDQNAESYYGLPGSLDGFFVRDDVGADMEDDFGTEFSLITSSGICGPENSDAGDMQGEGGGNNGCAYSCNGYKETTLLGSMSQDQVIYLLLGLRMLHEFIPTNHFIYSMNVPDRVSQITHRIVSYVRADNNNDEEYWTIWDPQGYTVGRGCCAKFFAHPMAIIGKDITGNTYSNNNEAGWIATKGSIGWQTEVNINMILPLAALSGNMTRNKLWNNSNDWEKEIWQLVYNILHENNMQRDISKPFWENLLASAPCDGPCDYPLDSLATNPGIPCTPTPGWYHHNRWMSKDGKDTPTNTLTDPSDWGEYNGLDFMLAYNLYRIAFNSGVNEPFGNYNREAVASGGSAPIIVSPSNCFVCDDNPFTAQVGTTYELDNFEIKVLNPGSNPVPGNMSVKAGERITLGTGFQVERGAYFHAWVLPWEDNCELGENYQWLTADFSDEPSLPESSIKDVFAEPQVNVYPVPTDGRINVLFKNWQDDTEVEVIVWDLLGRKVVETKRNMLSGDQLTLDLSAEPEGIYILSVNSDDFSVVKQIVVARE